MTGQEQVDFESWTEGYFMDGKQWAGYENMMPLYQAMTRTYDKFIDLSVINEGVELTRLSDAQLIFGKGKHTATLAQIQKLQGQEISAKGNMSFSAAAEGLDISGTEPPIQYKLKIPKGTKGAAMWIGDERVNPNWESAQREVITNRDIVMKIGKARKKKLSNGREVIEVDLMYQRRMPHDYGG